MSAEWIKSFEKEEWDSPAHRQYIIGCIEDGEEAQRKLNEIMPIYEKQCKYVELLERQLELLQKTLDLAEKMRPRLIMVEGDKIIDPIEDLANDHEDGPKKYFSPEDVRKMSQREVRQNYTAIINSMSKWRMMRYETDQET
jgi:hypothetical protein